MRMVFGLVLIVGLGLAGFAVYMAQGYINKTQAELARERASKHPPVPTVTVYVAKKALAYGDTLTADDVQAIAWPKNALPETAFTELKGKDDKALFVNNSDALRVALRPIGKFEPILVGNVTKPGQDAGITSRLVKGMRAFAIKVDVASGVSGFLRPGDQVDIYWTGTGRRQWRRPDPADRGRRQHHRHRPERRGRPLDLDHHRPHRDRRGQPAAGCGAGPGPGDRPAGAVAGRHPRHQPGPRDRGRPATACSASRTRWWSRSRRRGCARSSSAAAATWSRCRSPAPTETEPDAGAPDLGCPCLFKPMSGVDGLACCELSTYSSPDKGLILAKKRLVPHCDAEQGRQDPKLGVIGEAGSHEHE